MNLYEILDKLNIKFQEVTHKAVYTVEEALQERISQNIKGTECKNLFVKSKDDYYLILIKANKKANLKELASLVSVNRLTFASEEELNEILNLSAGSVTPLGLINDKQNRVTLLIDRDLEDNNLLLHPNINTKTISLKYDDLIKFITYIKHKYYIF